MKKETKNYKMSEAKEQILLDYIPFNPEKGLDLISKITDKDLKKESLAAYKKELFEQKIGLADLINELKKTILQNPDIDIEELKEIVYSQSSELKMSPKQLAYFYRVINRYYKQHQIVKKYQEKNISGKEIYQKKLQQSPEGEIDLTYRPITLNLEFDNWSDFARYFLNKIAVSEKDIQDLKDTNAALIFDGGLDDLIGGTVALSPNKSQSAESDKTATLLHEEMHAFNRLLDKNFDIEAMRLIKKRVR